MSCELMLKDKTIKIDKQTVKLASGDCLTDNAIYLADCSICHKRYTGKTTQHLRQRINNHRASWYKYLREKPTLDYRSQTEDLDQYALAFHLQKDHGLTDKSDFNKTFKFSILEVVAPKNMAKKEHLWIQRCRTLYPEGLNLNSPFGFPLL